MAFQNEMVRHERLNHIDPMIIKVDHNCDRIIPLPTIIKVKEMRTEPLDRSSEGSSRDSNSSPSSNYNENEIICDDRVTPINSISGNDQFVHDRRRFESTENNSSTKKFVFTLPGTIMFYMISLSFITLIPYHDVKLLV